MKGNKLEIVIDCQQEENRTSEGVEAVHGSGQCQGAGNHGSVGKIQGSAANLDSRLR